MAVGVIAACTSRVGEDATSPPARAVASNSVRAPTAPAIVSADQPFFEYQVEQQVRQIPGTGTLRYPEMLRSAKVEGEVLVQFVVGAEGRYEPGTLKVLKSSHELFAQAVTNAVPAMRFVPAQIGGRKVRQVVQQPFTFAISR
jgi:protein TonB